MTTRQVLVFHPTTAEAMVCEEQPHPKDGQFLGYKVQRGPSAGQWLNLAPGGQVSLVPDPGSEAAFTLAKDAAFIIADRTAPVFKNGRCYRLGYIHGTEPLGPIA